MVMQQTGSNLLEEARWSIVPFFIYTFCRVNVKKKFRQSNEIRSIFLFSKEIKLSQFTDDTNVFLCDDLESVENSLRSVNSFGDNSGLTKY